jgi:hypothetical protein
MYTVEEKKGIIKAYELSSDLKQQLTILSRNQDLLGDMAAEMRSDVEKMTSKLISMKRIITKQQETHNGT